MGVDRSLCDLSETSFLLGAEKMRLQIAKQLRDSGWTLLVADVCNAPLPELPETLKNARARAGAA